MFLIFSGKYFNRFLDILRYIRESVCMKPSIISDDIFVIVLSYKSSWERLYNVSLSGIFSAFKEEILFPDRSSQSVFSGNALGTWFKPECEQSATRTA